MNKDTILFWGSLFVWGIVFGVVWSIIAKGCNNANSSPVEEMYHRQLVITLDSILDARFGTGCCEEDTDTINANTFRSRFSSTLSSID